jgi:hypothetical protein
VAIGFLRDCRSRRVVALIAIAALVLQTVFAGLASAQAASVSADALGVICHHDASGGEPADVPDSGKAEQDCCVFCTAAAVAIVMRPMLLRFVPRAVSAALPFSRPAVVIARSIVRAGQSQAPPRIA